MRRHPAPDDLGPRGAPAFVWKPGSPFYGCNTSKDRAALRVGEFALLQDLRHARGVLSVRGGIDPKNATGLSGNVFRGRWAGYVNGVLMQFVALSDGSFTRVFKSVLAAGTAFAEVTASSGKYGDTRLDASSNVAFSVVREPTDSTLAPFSGRSGRDLVCFSDGSTFLVHDPVAGETAKHVKSYIGGHGAYRQEATLPEFFDFSTANVAVASSGGTVTVTDNSAHPDTGGETPRMQFSVGVAINDWGEFQFTTGAEVATGQRVMLIYDTAGDVNLEYPWDRLKVQLYDGTLRTLWDPSASGVDRPQHLDCEKGFRAAVFEVDRSAVPDSTYTRLRLTWVGAKGGTNAPPTATFDLYVFAVVGGGKVPGGRLYEMTGYNSGSRSESASRVCRNLSGRPMAELGCQDRRNNIRIPVSTAMDYAYLLTAVQPPDADRDRGQDYLLVYETDESGSSFLVAADQTASYAGSWSNTGGRAAGQKFTVTVNTEDINARKAPDAHNIPAPPCTAMVSVSGRLVCGKGKSAKAGGSVTGSDVYFSEQDQPFRFRESVRMYSDGTNDPSSGGKATFPGETVQAVAALTSAPTGDQSLGTAFVFTDKGVSGISTADSLDAASPRRVSVHGTLSPWSVVEHEGTFIYFSKDKEVRRLGEARSLSEDVCDDIATAVPDSRVAYVSSAVRLGRYYMAYTLGGGTTNRNVLVFDAVDGTFIARDNPVLSVTFAAFHTFGDQLRFWTETGALYEHDAPSVLTDNGTGIAPKVHTWELASDFWERHTFSGLGAVVSGDDDTGHTLSCKFVGRTVGDSVAGTFAMDASGTTYKLAKTANGGDVTLTDIGVYAVVEGTLKGGTDILAIHATVAPAGAKPAA